MPRWLVWILLNMLRRKEFGTTNYYCLRTRSSEMYSSSLAHQNSWTSNGTAFLQSDQPWFMYFWTICKIRFLFVSSRNSVRWTSLIGRFQAKCTSYSSTLLGAVNGCGPLLRVPAIKSLPFCHIMWKKYFWILSIMRWMRAGADPIGFLHKASSGLWSVSTVMLDRP